MIREPGRGKEAQDIGAAWSPGGEERKEGKGFGCPVPEGLGAGGRPGVRQSGRPAHSPHPVSASLPVRSRSHLWRALPL